MPNINDLLSKAIQEINNLNVDEPFLVKDLFKGYEWNRIMRSDRLLLGTLFLNYAKQDSSTVIPIEKSKSGQQRYKRVS